MKRLVLDNDYVKLWVHSDSRIVHHEFKKFVWGDAFQEALNRGHAELVRAGATKWLSDDRERSALSKADVDWSFQEWFPKMVAAGWKYWAIVLPDDVIGQMNMDRIMKKYSAAGVTTRVFNDPDAALAWLEDLA